MLIFLFNDPFTDRIAYAITFSALVREVWGLNPGLSNRTQELPMARHRCHFSKGAVLPKHNVAAMGLTNSLHAWVLYYKYNEGLSFFK